MGCFPSRLRPLELANALRFPGSVEKGGSGGGGPVASSTARQGEHAKLEPLLPGKLALPKPRVHVLKSIPSDRDFSDNTPHGSGRQEVPERRTAQFASTSSSKPMDAASSVPTLSSPPRSHKKEATKQQRQMKRTSSAPEAVDDRGGGGGTSLRQRSRHQSPDRLSPDGQMIHGKRQDGGDTSSQLPPSDAREEQRKEGVSFASSQRNSLRREAHMNNIRRAWQSKQEHPGEAKPTSLTPSPLSSPAKVPPPRLSHTEAHQSAQGEKPSFHSEKVNLQELKARTVENELETSKQKGVVFTQVQMPTCTLNFTTVQDSSIDLAKAQDIFKITDRNNHRHCHNYPEQRIIGPAVTYNPNCRYGHPQYPINVPSPSPPAYYAWPKPPRYDSPRHYRHPREINMRPPRDDRRNQERRNIERELERRSSDRRSNERTRWTDRRSHERMRNERIRNERSDDRRAHRDLVSRPREHVRDSLSLGHKHRTRSPKTMESERGTSSSSYNRGAPASRKKSYHREQAEHSRRKRKKGEEKFYSALSGESRSDHDRYRSKMCNRCNGVKSPSPAKPCRCHERQSRNLYRPSSPPTKQTSERLSGSRRDASRRARSYEACRCKDDEVWYYPYDCGEDDRVYRRRRPVATRDRTWKREDFTASSDGEEPYAEKNLRGCLILRPKGYNRSYSCSGPCRKRISWHEPVIRRRSRHKMHFLGEERGACPCRSPSPYSNSWRYTTDDNCSSSGAECCSCQYQPYGCCRLCGHERRHSSECDCIYYPDDCSENAICEDFDSLCLSRPVTMRVLPEHFKRSRSADEITLQGWRGNRASPHKLEWALEPLHPKRSKPRYRELPIRRVSGHGYCRGLGSRRRYCNDLVSGRHHYHR